MNTHDSHEMIFPADPRITAYAFGELEGDELARIEAAVQADPALQTTVAELRGFGGQLTAMFINEPPIAPMGDAPAAPAGGSGGGDFPAPSPSIGHGLGGLIAKLPGFYYLAGGLAAAGFAVLAVVHTQTGLEKPTPAVKRDAPAIIELVAGPKAKGDLTKRLTKMRSAPRPSVGNEAGGVRFDMRQSAAVATTMPTPTPVAKMEWSLSSSASVSRQDSPAGKDLDGLRAGSTESYAFRSDNAYRTVAAEPLSTFSIDVDTASYANVRRFITSGCLPPADAVRVEELINYFPYRYAPPMIPPLGVGYAGKVVPFSTQLEVASAPWAPAHRLVRIGLKGRELTAATRPAANLVFLLDVSGSMESDNKLLLVKESLRLLVERLRPDDRVAIVTYAGSSGLALPSTPASQKREILAALDDLRATGSTNGAMGIHLAYDIAKANFATGGINRVILCTDGDFNVGVTDRNELVRLIEEKAKSRVFLSVFGFGMDNLKDNTLESLADKGNGTYGYIDTRREAEKVFVEQTEGTLATIAKDVKVQVEFNPARVASYRLIGYENRLLAKEDFNNDAVDAGDVGAGHTVTALYEVVPVNTGDEGAPPRPVVDPLKYQKPKSGSRKLDVQRTDSSELLTVKIRYKEPEGDVSAKQEFPLIDGGQRFDQAGREFQFAAAVAAWGMLLRDSPHKGTATIEQVLAWAEAGLGDDAGGYRAEFIQLVRRSAQLSR